MPLDNNLLATPGDVAQFAVPGAFLDDYSGRFFQSRQISSINKFLHRSADHLFRSPTIQTLGAATPVANAVVQIADGDGLMRLVEHGGLLNQSLIRTQTLGDVTMNDGVEFSLAHFDF